ncbi:MAG: hypothetical protein U0872_05840 [Planctomycetaceae bacterium]
MSNSRSSSFTIIARMFAFTLMVTVGCSIFWNTLSGSNMLPLAVAFWVAVVLTVLFVVIGWATVTLGSSVLLRDDAEFQKWKAQGGRPYLDSLPQPIKPDSAITRQTGIAEPEYTDFVPNPDWKYQCPFCGSKVEKKIDICRRCGFGRDGDSTAYYQRWGNG